MEWPVPILFRIAEHAAQYVFLISFIGLKISVAISWVVVCYDFV